MMRGAARRHLWTCVFVAASAGCAWRTPRAWDAAGPQADALEQLWWLFFGVTCAVYVLVLGTLGIAMLRRREPELGAAARTSTQVATVIAVAAALTLMTLLALLTASTLAGGRVAAFRGPDPITIAVRGHQWWWDVEYDHSVPSQRVRTANEIHVPVGRPIRLVLTSRDVIHSFWVPQLHGKKDLIPGYATEFWLQADRAGVFEGQCGEFCGHQHAKMTLAVIAHAPADFERWLASQRQSPAAPVDSEAARGQVVFQAKGCALCHAVRGTPAGGREGPDLSHLASRAHIAGASYPNRRGFLAGWISDPQGMKPGVRMPPTLMAAEDLHALVAYLEGLR